jgi:subtilisin family serine protease
LPIQWDIVTVCPARSRAKNAIAFSALPFVALRAFASRPDGDVLARYGEHRLALLRALDWFLANQVDVVNLSLAPHVDRRFDARDPLQVATRALELAGTVVVVAAGNDGPAADTLQILARAEWVISVGAIDADGSLLKRSSRGVSGGPRPTVVADGTDPFDPPYEPGTSFAAPRVAALAAWLKTALVLSARDYTAAGGPSAELSDPLPFPKIGIADTGAERQLWSQGSQLARSFLDRGENEVRLIRTAAERSWYRAVRDVVANSDVAFDVAVTPAAVRRALTLIARPVPDAEPEDAGAGYVSVAEVGESLVQLSPSRWFEFFGAPTELQALTTSLDEQLGPLWDSVKVQTLRDLFWRGVRPYVAKVT